MNIFALIGVLLIIYSFNNYKKAFVFFLFFRMFLNQNINLINIPGIPLLTLEFTLCFLFWIIFLLKRKELVIDKRPFPLVIPFVFIILSYFLSSIFGLAGISNSFFNLLKTVFEDYVSIWMIWILLCTKKDYIFFLKGVSLVFFFSVVYGLYEAYTHTNPLMDYELSIAGTGSRVLDFAVGEDYDERGYRIRSIFFHCIGAGINWGLYFAAVFYLFFYFRNRIITKYKIMIFTACLSVVCLFIANSRSPIIFLMIVLLAFFIKMKFKNIFALVTSFVVLGIGLSYNSKYLDNIFSIFNSSAQQKVGGSNLEMRVDQFNAAFHILNEYPFFGIGLKSLELYSNKEVTAALLGMESMWMQILVIQGIFGILAAICLIFFLVYKIGYKRRNWPVFFLCIAYFVTFSVTSVPGYLTFLMYSFIFMFIKLKMENDKTLSHNSKQKI